MASRVELRERRWGSLEVFCADHELGAAGDGRGGILTIALGAGGVDDVAPIHAVSRDVATGDGRDGGDLPTLAVEVHCSFCRKAVGG